VVKKRRLGHQPLYTEEPVSGYNVGEYNQPLYTEELVSGYNVGEYNQPPYIEVVLGVLILSLSAIFV
jgi:hypothetical protein